MTDPHDLAHALDAHGVADWFVLAREQQLGELDELAPGTARAEARTRWQLVVHDDTPHGRGSAYVEIDAALANVDAVVEDAVALARASVGVSWTSSPPAAPAQVLLHDEAVLRAEPLATAAPLLRGPSRPGGARVTARASILREQVTALGRSGLRASWSAALIAVHATLARGERSLVVARHARRIADLDLERAWAHADADLALLAVASDPTPGPCSVVLGVDAMLHGGLGVWEAFASQADAVTERQGLTRYRERSPIVEGADQLDEPLSIASDGALDFATRSAPLGDDGGAVRRFALVENGVAVGLALSPREAALRGRDPNGGVRNLVVAPGSWSGAVDDLRAGDGGRVVEVRRVGDLAIDRYTGEARLEIALALDHSGSSKPRAFTGGTLRVDLIDALAHARRSATRIRRGAYDGPQIVGLPVATLIA